MPRPTTRLSIGSVLLAVFALVVIGTPAQAAFPGANGKIAFDSDLDDGGVQGDIYTVYPDGSGLTRLTNNPAQDTDGGWSPDGSRLTFASNRDGNLEVYVMNADGSGQTNVSNNSASDGDPSWSPDGTQIVFASNRGSIDFDVYKMNADGTGQTRLTTSSYYEAHPAWSPDGSKIAYEASPGVNSREIYEMNADGSGQTDLTNNPAKDTRANWSPDSMQIAFSSDRSGGGDIYKMSPDGSSQTSVSTSANQETAPAWSPDGARLSEVVNGSEGNPGGEVHTLSAAGGDEQIVTGPLGTYMANPDWQPILFTGYARPKGATPFRVPLVPAYKQCGIDEAADTHGAPLAYPSCDHPNQASGYATVGTPDANGKAAASVGSLTLKVIPADVRIAGAITDVRNASDLSDYTGSLEAAISIRITDRGNSDASTGTTLDMPYSFAIACSPTSDSSVGATCGVDTTADAIAPGTIKEGERAIWSLGRIRVFDGGPDGDLSTTPNTLFAVQGVFVP